MQSFFASLKLFGCVGAFGVLVASTGNATVSAVVVLLLAFGEPISAALRTRRVALEWSGFKGTIEGPTAADPPRPTRT